jgi:Ca-activated chloride channel homolog
MVVMFFSLRKIGKPFIFAAFGAIGGILGAAFGEVLFLGLWSQPHEKSTPIQSEKAVCLLLDCSGSMQGEKLTEMKRSAESFAARQDLGKQEIAVVGFESSVYPVCPPTHDLSLIQAGLRQLTSAGNTGMAQGLVQAGSTLQSSHLEKYILLFTDGMPDSKDTALQEAANLRVAGIEIVAVATNDADRFFLGQLTGSIDRVMTTQMGSFDEAFHKAEEMIYHGLITHSNASSFTAIVQTVSWSALLSIFIGLLLVMAQNAYLRRYKLLNIRVISLIIVAGSLAGAIAGLAGQYIYTSINSLTFGYRGIFFGVSFSCLGLILWMLAQRRNKRKAEMTRRRYVLYILMILVVAWLLSRIVLLSFMIQDALSRTIGLALIGLLVGMGFSFFIPNLGKIKGLVGGLVGGVAAGILFVWISKVGSDTGARIVGALALGAGIGYMIALVESVWREAYLEVEWGPKEKNNINLGGKAILFGSSSDCHVYLQDYPPVAASVILKQGKITFEDRVTGKTQELQDGNKLKIGTLMIHIHAYK